LTDEAENKTNEGKKKIEAKAEPESKPLHGTYVASDHSGEPKKKKS
jgi:hypothetical protein